MLKSPPLMSTSTSALVPRPPRPCAWAQTHHLLSLILHGDGVINRCDRPPHSFTETQAPHESSSARHGRKGLTVNELACHPKAKSWLWCGDTSITTGWVDLLKVAPVCSCLRRKPVPCGVQTAEPGTTARGPLRDVQQATVLVGQCASVYDLCRL